MRHAEEETGKHAKIKSEKFWIWVLLSIIVIAIIALISLYMITNTEEYANKKMTELVSQYYETNLKRNSAPVNRIIVTLQTLEEAGFNISGVKGKPGVSEDLSKAFSYIIVENSEETDKEKITYIIENHLNGE